MSVQDRAEEGSAVALFADELIAVRAKAGLSQAELAKGISYSPSAIAMIEQRRRAPMEDIARRLDAALDTPGTFFRLWRNVRNSPLPAWFRPYADIEAVATQIRSWQPLVVPGLLQTEDYARALLGVEPNTTEDVLEERVLARMGRQAILDRDQPPVLWVLLDEGVLHRPVGGPEVMHDQLRHLERMSHRPNITIGIVPLGTGQHAGLLGALAVAESETARVGFMENHCDSVVGEDAESVTWLAHVFDSLAAETLPRAATRDLILRWAAEHDD